MEPSRSEPLATWRRTPATWRRFAFWLLCLWAAAAWDTAAGALLSGAFTPLPSGTNVNLSAEGQLDWVQWGLESPWTLDRKYGVTQQITNTFLAPNNFNNYYDGPYDLTTGAASFGWSDGVPDLSVSNTAGGVYIYGDKLSTHQGTGTGFQIQCPADTTLKQLRLYVGTSGAAATLNATLNGAAAYLDNSLGGAALGGIYTIDFQADSPGQVLTVSLTSTDTSGYIYLQAATLSGPDLPPTVSVTAPAQDSVFAAPATFTLSAAASDADGAVTNLSLLITTNFSPASSSAVLAWTNANALGATLSNLPAGDYSLTAVATDDAGLTVTSLPANILVTSGGGVLAGSVAWPSNAVDLTAEGTLDWVHWGLVASNSVDRKAGVTPVIPDVQLLNATTNDLQRYADNLSAYSWSDGTPTPSVTASRTGVFLYSTNNPPAGFELAVPATNELRRLKVYVGLYADHARMEAWMSDWSAASYSDQSLSSASGNDYAVYTFDFSSTNAGALLHVRWSPATVLDPFYGNVTWQAATLSSLASANPAPLALVAPAFAPPNQFSFSFYAQTGLTYTIWYNDSIDANTWQTLTNFPGSGQNVTITDPGAAASARFYRVQAQ